MQLQTFQGSTMAEALQRVKTSLGGDAVILHTRTVFHKRWMGFKRVEAFEITASRNVNVVKRQIPARPAPSPQPKPAAKAATQYIAKPVPVKPVSVLETSAGQAVAVNVLTKEVGELKSLVKDLVKETRRSGSPQVPEEVQEYYDTLVQRMVADELALEITKKLHRQLRPEMLANKELVREKLAEHLEKLIPTAGPILRTKLHGPHIVALIGPTGVGKTTTIAKLAATLKLREKKKVGLITIDTFRIAAIDQLKRYADILNTPLRVVGSPEEIKATIAGLSDCEYILIDTAGRSPKDSLKINELKRFLTLAEPDEVHLVLSTTASESCVELAMKGFGEVGVDKLIFTKLDEAAQIGVVVNVASKLGKGLAYVTTGQDVPDDIEVGHGRRLANLILGHT